MWNKEPELYRRWYYARKGSGATTKRKSLKTTSMDVARQRLVDLARFDDAEPALIRDLYAQYCEEKENKYRDLEYMWRSLGPHFGHLRPDQITRNVCKDYITNEGLKDGTMIRRLGALRAALKWFDPNTPAVFYFPPSPPPKERYLTRLEVKRLLEACREPHIRLYIILAICTAGRKSALLELTWDRVDFEKRQINLGTGQDNKRRAIVPMNTSAEYALEDAYRARLTDNVIEHKGKPIKDVKRGFATCVRDAGLEDVSPNTLRHTSAVWMAESKNPMSEIAQYLGHTSTKITEKVYARYSPDHLRGPADALELEGALDE